MTDNYIHITEHASKRAIKRFMMSAEKLKELACKAVSEGYSVNDAPSKELRKYLKSKTQKKRKVYIYSGYCFVFNVTGRMHLITAFRVPKYYLNTIK